MKRDIFKSKVLNFIEDATTLGLCTVDDSAQPHACNVNYVYDNDLNFYFVSNLKTNHAQHILKREQVAATIYTPFTRPAEIRGLQIKAHCHPQPPENFDQIWQLYRQQIPDVEHFEPIARSETMFKLSPHYLKWIDNTEHFGYKVETNWP